MSTQATTQNPLTVNQPGSAARQQSVADFVPSATPRRRTRRSPISSGLLLLLVVAAVIGWGLTVQPTAADDHAPQKWAYVLTLQGSPAKKVGPFVDVTACNLSLTVAIADLNQRLPGLYIARPCTASASSWLQSKPAAAQRTGI